MQTLNKNKALVLFSGGQDSAISLAYALERYQSVETIGFDYGQRHAVELGARSAIRKKYKDFSPKWDEKLGTDIIVDLNALARIGDSAMTDAREIEMLDNGLPNTFVPGRNLIFLSFAGAHAYRQDIGTLVAGMCQADYSGYPDCRDEAMQAQLSALRLGMDADIDLDTPLMTIEKSESWQLAEKLGGTTLVDLINEYSHSCYRGIRTKKFDWGYGCDDCPACDLRKKGWEKYKQTFVDA